MADIGTVLERESSAPGATLFSHEQLESHALRLAGAHEVSADPRRARPLLPRLDRSATRLADAYQFLSAEVPSDLPAVASEDWLRDNYFIVQDQIREVRHDLPRRFYLQLPKLAHGPYEGYPRVYLIARELIAHTAGRLDLEMLVDFTAAYQREAPLSIGETWAIPIMLRLGLVEELQRLVDGVVAARRSREQARKWETALAARGALRADDFDRLLEAEVESNGRLSPAFVVELMQWLRDQPLSAAGAWQALRRALEAQSDAPDALVRLEHQREATDQLGIGNIVTSMRLLSSIDWSQFFDRVSVVEQVLSRDPAGAYAGMDFGTRDRYRHSIEELSRRSKTPELVVAQRAIAEARDALEREPLTDRRHHVGFYLISRGRFTLEAALRYRPSVRERLARFVFEHPTIGYPATIGLATALGVSGLLAYAHRHGATTAVELWLIGLIVFVPASELAIALLNSLLTAMIRPRQLPKLALKSGIPAHSRTVVVVPAIIDSASRIDTLFHDLEVRCLANRDPHLHFALLSDLPDAPTEVTERDAALVELARTKVDALNTRHGADRFLLCHRQRRWNGSQQQWIGWERKRGKLAEFNRLLRGATDTSFVVLHGAVEVLRSIRYVITLDSDTHLPIDAGRRLVGALSHPLNRPRFNERLGRVTEGYGILQPRVQVSVESAARTSFAQVYSGHVGLDPYTTAVSDVYQDLFHEGTYVGKGIYDVDAFEAALAGRIPENALLSHDLFEGLYARAGLCTDIDVVDDYPSNYLAFASRQHRWVRGDWQILRWLWPTVPDASGRVVANHLPAIARWKILDNLRRSLLAPALIALLLAGWTVLPGSTMVWSGLALMVLAFPAYMQVGRSLTSRVRGVPLREHVLAERDTLAASATQAFLATVFLLHQSGVMLDAIIRTLIRLFTRQRMLEWVTAERATRVEPTLRDLIRHMLATPLVAGAVALLVGVVAPLRLAIALPVVMLWAASPLLAYATGRPLPGTRPALSAEQRAAFRRAARKMWRFFDDLVTPTDNWLIPDNIQENRRELVAHRTSPTNIGLQLLSTLASYDFGYITLSGLLTRLEATFATLLRMQRYRGHFYNWYDTRTLEPLAPGYISTVDSGNLVGYLVTLRAALLDVAERAPAGGAPILEGLDDAVGLVEEELARAPMKGAKKGDRAAIRKELAALRTELALPLEPGGGSAHLGRIRERISAAGLLLHEFEEPLLAAGAESASAVGDAVYWLDQAAALVAERIRDSERPLPPSELLERVERLASLADDLVEETEFEFLFDRERQLFSIGFNVVDGRLDGSYYDTLASEARLASFLAIAIGNIPPEHWFKLGRSLTSSGGSRALLSWSASMFEYLMPLLVMRTYPGTLLHETYQAVVLRQIQYAAQRGVPWGISESAYNARDLDGNYQYRAFGVPGLGLKRGLAEDLVIAPYASFLAAPIAPDATLDNLDRLRTAGLEGTYSFYEAIDYTPERLPAGETGGLPLPTYMAHHQGMSLIAIDNAINGSPMQQRFHADPRVQAAELLLQERIPHLVPLKNPPIERTDHVPAARRLPALVRRYITPHTLSPRTHFLSNGSYAVMLTNAGGGFSRRQSLAMTRWREDTTADSWGTFIYLRDVQSGDVWSTTYQPTDKEPDEYEVTFAPDRATYRRVDGPLETRTEIVVSPEDDVELRRVSITNHGREARTVDLTSYAEVVLAPQDADLAHPAFSNLFVETMAVPGRDALICVRRPRSGTVRLHLVHVLSGRSPAGDAIEYETDRARFLGRGRGTDRPVALQRRLSNTTGTVLDPIVSLRHTVRIPPGGTARIGFTTGFADNESDARQLIEKYHDRRAVARALALASTHSDIELRHLGLTVDETMTFQRLSGRLMYGDPRLRPAEAVRRNARSQAELWKYGISGDLPILLVHVKEAGEAPLLLDLLKGHEYLRRKGLVFDLVVLNDHASSYLQDLQNTLVQMVEGSPEQSWVDRPGGVFLRRSDLMPPDDRTLLEAAARVVMDGADGHLHQQLKRPQIPFGPEPGEIRERGDLAPPSAPAAEAMPAAADLESFNGIGGFADHGREYVIVVDEQAGGMPPQPWANVVAHPTFGFVATESSTGYTWSRNSHDNRLTPWSNDPVSDPSGEAIFIRDEDTGRFWSATPRPAGSGGRYVVRHGQGYSIFDHERNDLRSTLVVFVPPTDEVKVFHLTLRNETTERRRVTVTLYVDFVLGENRTRSHLHVVTSQDEETQAIFARNAFRQEFARRVAFLDLHPGDARSVTGDRTEFLGRNGRLSQPAAMRRASLSGRTGPALDPCGAIQVAVDLGPSETRTLAGLLGDAVDEETAREQIRAYRDSGAVDAAMQRVVAFWDRLLGTVVVRTPDRSLDLLLNRWLLYQCVACRLWGRSAFYQSSGAFGFRDQLQDVLALLMAAPHTARTHLLHAATRQFVEGDVQHWWHEPGGQGVRTLFSDDRLWLVYAALEYVAATGDEGVLGEHVPFLEGRRLEPGEHEAYGRPSISVEQASLYEHCARAVAISLATGPHGLPLIGTGDWNDGMNLVGPDGRGESVWLAWFLLSILPRFAEVAEARGDTGRAAEYRAHVERLRASVEAEAWDGEWYRRAYFDDGTPLGSRENSECRIDAIAQSWAVLSRAADPGRARQAMESVDTHLIRRDDGLSLLLTPPFDQMVPTPGYIRGYVPGVRENGGQYTHAALWTVLAFAQLGDGNRAMELFAMLNPVNRTRGPEDVARYRAEPYVVAADVYSAAGHSGRGGWTWYTGSAGWMYRVGVEGLLGLSLRRGALHIEPCIPDNWPGYELIVKTQAAELRIVVENPEQVSRGVRVVEFDGVPVEGDVPLADVTGTHVVRVVLGKPRQASVAAS